MEFKLGVHWSISRRLLSTDISERLMVSKQADQKIQSDTAKLDSFISLSYDCVIIYLCLSFTFTPCTPRYLQL